MTDTTNLGLPCIEGSQAQKHVTHNEALRILDTLVQLAVADRDLTVPPSAPAEGQRWIVKTTATGAWAGHDHAVAAWQDGAWQFSTPQIGWSAFVVDEGTLVVWNGTGWGDFFSAVTSVQNLALLGVGTTADATNPLSAKLNNALFTAKPAAEGGSGDLRYKLNKEAAGNTLSLLLQDNYSGRAEIGLTGDDDFHFKVSPDGSSWVEALKLNKTSGAATFGGPLALEAGSPSAPSVAFDGDSDTGLYRIGADRLGFAANGSLLLDMNYNGGNPGLVFYGGSNPGAGGAQLTVGDATSYRLSIWSNSTGGYGAIQMWQAGVGYNYPLQLQPSGGGVTVGSPSGGNKGDGTINVAGDIYKNNTAYTNPDFVFEHFYRGGIAAFAERERAKDYDGLLPLAALRAYTRENLRLPRVGDGPCGAFERSDVALEKIEEAHLYLMQLHEELCAATARIAALEEAARGNTPPQP